MNRTKLLATALLFATLACAESTTDPESVEIARLSSGTSFGMCAGYCITELVIDSTTVTFIETSRVQQLPPRTRTISLTRTEWQRIRSRVDAAVLSRMAGVHGCPDCADGGAEWIELRTAQSTVRVTFEFGRVLAEISELQAEIRAVRNRFPRP